MLSTVPSACVSPNPAAWTKSYGSSANAGRIWGDPSRCNSIMHVGWLGAVGTHAVAGDPAVPAFRRQPGVHPRRRAAVQRQRGKLQRLVSGAAVAAAFPSAGRPTPRTDAIAGSGQHPARPPTTGRTNTGAASSGSATTEAASKLRRAYRTSTTGRGACDVHPAREWGWDRHAAESILPGRKEASGTVPAASGRHE